MAVVKIIGTADNIEIVFERDGGDQWVATVPFDIDGTYVVEVRAYDEAGNESYRPKMLFTVDTSKLVMKLEPLKYDGEILMDNFSSTVLISKYCFDCEVNRDIFLMTIRSQKYYVEVVHVE